jgi:hypothetical protein
LVREGRVRRFVTDDEIRHAIHHPPRNTRAYFRGSAIRKFAKQMTAVQWDELAFADAGRETVVKLLNVFDDAAVTRYNAAIDNAADVATLLRNLNLDRR